VTPAAPLIESILGPNTTRSAVVRKTLGPLASEGAFAQWRCHGRAWAEGPTELDLRVRALQAAAPSIGDGGCSHCSAPPLGTTQRAPAGEQRIFADGSAHIAHRCAFSALQRLAVSSLIALPPADCASLAEHTKLNKERAAIFQQRCSGRIGPYRESNHGAVTAATSRKEPVQEFWMFVRAIACVKAEATASQSYFDD
jgi:hypothetical protein